MKGRLVVSHVVVHMLLEHISDIVCLCCDLFPAESIVTTQCTVTGHGLV